MYQSVHTQVMSSKMEGRTEAIRATAAIHVLRSLLDLCRGHMTSQTYRPPKRKIPNIVIFCRLGRDSWQADRMGIHSMTISRNMFEAENA